MFGFSMCLASHSNAFDLSFEWVWLLVRIHLAFHSNTFGSSYERSWLLVRMQLASHSNEFHPTINCVQAVEQMHSYTERTRLDKKKRYTLCLTGTVYEVPASIDLTISSFSSIINTTFLRLNVSAILHTSLQFYSINNVTTVHVQSNQGCVQIIKGSYCGGQNLWSTHKH